MFLTIEGKLRLSQLRLGGRKGRPGVIQVGALGQRLEFGEDLVGLDMVAHLDLAARDLAVGAERDVDLCLSLDVAAEDDILIDGCAARLGDPHAQKRRIVGGRGAGQRRQSQRGDGEAETDPAASEHGNDGDERSNGNGSRPMAYS